RDFHVTGVQTCALPISRAHIGRDHDVLPIDRHADQLGQHALDGLGQRHWARALPTAVVFLLAGTTEACGAALACDSALPASRPRSEEHTSELQSRENLV